MENTASFREATMDDFQSVMDIAEIYHGADYLPSKYEDAIKSAHNKCYVGIVNGQIVAFVIGSTVDGGETLVTRAGRVKDMYKGQGVYGALNKFVRKQLTASGRVKNEAFTTHSDNFDQNKDKIKASFTELFTKNVICYRYKGNEWNQFPKDLPNTPKRLQTTDLARVISSEASCKHLFSNNRMIIDWTPFRPLSSNIDLMSPHMLMLGSRRQNTSNGDNDVIYTCLTIGSHYNCKLGLEYSLDVFGDDVTELRQHVLVHMENVMCLAAGNDYEIAIIFPSTIIHATIDSILSDLNMPTPIRKQTELLYLFENNLSNN